jgi:HPt (histidine-containing phosphotransfer) domain-containing protein
VPKPAQKVKKDKAPAHQKTLDLTYLSELAEGNQEFIKEVLEIFIKEVPEDLEALQQAIKEAEYRQIKDISHKLKSSIILTGLGSLRPYLQEMERLALQSAGLNEIKKEFAHVNAVFNTGVEEAKKMI